VLQIAGEMIPSLAVPTGAAAGLASKIPMLGNLMAKAGVGSRALPTLAADSGILGAVQGAATPTTSEDSVLMNTVAGGALGALAPGALAGLGKVGGAILKPISNTLQRRGAAQMLGDVVDTSPAAQRSLQKAVNESGRRVVDAPQSLATVTQNTDVAALEKAARANPETSGKWASFDERAKNAKWKALDDVLGSNDTVQAARDATDAYARDAIPEVFKRVNKTAMTGGVADFSTGVRGRLTTAVKNADPAAQEVYGYTLQALEAGNGSPQMMWNIRKTLKGWMEGTPPPGKEGTRGAKIDVPVKEVTDAIDNVLNGATGKSWGRFLSKFGEHAQAEAKEKAGQNIRNAFLDETLASTRGPTSAAGNPAVTRAKLEQALLTHGKNKFGETLDYRQRNVIDQVLGDLRGEEILDRVTKSMTGGGAQTAPLLALMKKTGALGGSGILSDIANITIGSGQRAQRQIISDALQDPQEALALIRMAEKIRRPLSTAEKNVVQAARAFLASPSALVLTNAAANTPAQ
jgi:hypothetical protein